MKFTGEQDFTKELTLEQKLEKAEPISREIQTSDNSYIIGIDISNIAGLYEKLSGERNLALPMVTRTIKGLINYEKVTYDPKRSRIYTITAGSEEEVRERLNQISKTIIANYLLTVEIVGLQPSKSDKQLIEGKREFYALAFNKLNSMLDSLKEKNNSAIDKATNELTVELYSLKEITHKNL